MQVSTVKVASSDTPQGWIVINETNYDPELHQLYTEDSPPAEEVSLTELRSLAGKEGIKGRSQMSREELIEALQAKGHEL